jgi:secretion/DNA translocation related TadE-like protein
VSPRPRVCDGDAGSATIVVLGIALVIVSAACAMVMLAAAICARHSAQAAADLAALAAAQHIGVDDGGCVAAADIAAVNRASLESCEIRLDADGRAGTVDIALSRPVGTGALAQWTARARARAERAPT